MQSDSVAIFTLSA